MKNILLTLFTVTYFVLGAFSQESISTLSKDDFMGTWRVCYGLDINETADTIRFQHASPGCRENECAEHQWSFRTEGSIEFVFTKGCDIGFNSISQNPKRWVYIQKDNLLKFISNDGFIDIYTVLQKTDDSLTLIRRTDLE